MPDVADLLDRESRTVDLERGDFERLAARRDRKQRARRIRAGTLAVVLVVIGAVVFVRALRSEPSTSVGHPTPTPAPSIWSPLREDGDAAVHLTDLERDPRDTDVPWVDLDRVRFSYDEGASWNLDIAARPPTPADREEEGLLVAYGLVLDANADGVADYVVGVDDDAPGQGAFRVWVTDLRTGETDERVGAPYGYPIEFRHPDEEDSGRNMMLTFLSGSAPPDLDGSLRFYAWASAARDGEVFATDYAPDTGWIGDPSVGDDPSYGWPDTDRNPPGEYSWDGYRCGDSTPSSSCAIGPSMAWMHNGYRAGDVAVGIEVVRDPATHGDATPVTVAGRNGSYRRIDAKREEWIVEIEGKTIVISIEAQPGASRSDLAEAHAIIDSMRTQGQDTDLGFRLVFTLTTNHWDSG